MKGPSLAGTEGIIRHMLNAVFSPLERLSIFKSLDKPGSRGSIRFHLIVGLVVVTLLTCGLGGWASTAQISGALIAPGSIVVDSNVKKVQHPTGGVVGEVRAHDGDRVTSWSWTRSVHSTTSRNSWSNFIRFARARQGWLSDISRISGSQF
jgi:HlyD family secretion protein